MRGCEVCQLAMQVLPEVLQQQARLDDPGAAARREIIRFDFLHFLCLAWCVRSATAQSQANVLFLLTRIPEWPAILS